MSSKIAWTEETWNPVVGCSKASPGCLNCYAERMAKRLSAMGQHPYDWHVLNIYGKWSGLCQLAIEQMYKPIKIKKPSRIFVCSMGDLFHENVPFDWVNAVFDIMAAAPQHTYIILTKRAWRMHEYNRQHQERWVKIPHLWAGVTAENQVELNKRAPLLLGIDVPVHFISVEPMLSTINVVGYLKNHYAIDWVICGGESGPGARPVQIEWVKSLRDQCVEVGTPFFFKQWGGLLKKKNDNFISGKRYEEYPIER